MRVTVATYQACAKRSRDGLGAAAAQAAAAGPDGGADGDAVEPRRQRSRPAERVGLAGEGEEGCLEGVLGRVGVGEDSPADAQDYRAVTGHQVGEGVGVAVADESAEQFRVGGCALQV